MAIRILRVAGRGLSRRGALAEFKQVEKRWGCGFYDVSQSQRTKKERVSARDKLIMTSVIVRDTKSDGLHECNLVRFWLLADHNLKLGFVVQHKPILQQLPDCRPNRVARFDVFGGLDLGKYDLSVSCILNVNIPVIFDGAKAHGFQMLDKTCL